MAARIPSVHSGRLRAASVSSIRSRNVPWCCLAKSQFWRADRAPPTWNIPVGEGAKRARTVTASTLRAATDPLTRGFRVGGRAVALPGGEEGHAESTSNDHGRRGGRGGLRGGRVQLGCPCPSERPVGGPRLGLGARRDPLDQP